MECWNVEKMGFGLRIGSNPAPLGQGITDDWTIELLHDYQICHYSMAKQDLRRQILESFNLQNRSREMGPALSFDQLKAVEDAVEIGKIFIVVLPRGRIADIKK